MKEKLAGTLGCFGVIIYYVFASAVFIMPFFVIDINKWLAVLLFGVQWFMPETSIIFWIWGLVSVIQWHSGTIAIIYYIMTAVIFLPFFISLVYGIIENIISKKD